MEGREKRGEYHKKKEGKRLLTPEGAQPSPLASLSSPSLTTPSLLSQLNEHTNRPLQFDHTTSTDMLASRKFIVLLWSFSNPSKI